MGACDYVLIEFPSNAHALLSEFCLVVTEPVRHLRGSESSLMWILMGGFRVLGSDTVIFVIVRRYTSKASYWRTIGTDVN